MQNKTILVVDDVIDNIDILLELLDDYNIITAHNGKTAIALAKKEEFDLILLDIIMPEMDGYEVCKQLKKNPKHKNTPIIFLSAKDTIEDIEIGFELGAVDYITKPFLPSELRARVSTHLKLRAYEKNLEKRVSQEVEKNHLKEQMIYQQSKQAALGELLMHIAHQWKQPLASLGSINTLQRVQLDQGISISEEELLNNVIKSEDLISFMSQTINTFKNFYNPAYEDEPFSLTDAVNKIINISHATLEYNDVKVNLTSYEKSTVYANENEFSQVIFSIINNALDIFKERNILHPQLLIEIYDNRVIIQDNGGGIDESIKENIFLPFKSTTKGNGIGLYIAKELIEKNNGFIFAKNIKHGAEFSVEFLEWLD